MEKIRWIVCLGVAVVCGMGILQAADEDLSLENFLYSERDHSGKQAMLVNGQFKGDHLSLSLLESAKADFNGDGKSEGVVVLSEDTGGSGTFKVLCLLMNDGSSLVNTSRIYLGDRIKLTGLVVEEKEILVSYLDRKPDEALSAHPSVEMVVRHRVEGVQLKRVARPKRREKM